MPEWLVERGIGETRAALVEKGEILEARVELDDVVPAGTIVEARLADGPRRLAVADDGCEYLLRSLPKGTSEGSRLAIEVVRPALPGPEPWKRPIARPATGSAACSPSFADRLGSTGYPVRILPFPAPGDPLSAAGWDDLVDEARNGEVAFAGGTLGLFPTPAMTLVDVDGSLAAADLAVAGASAAARTIRRLDIGGSIGIDLPTVQGKAARSAAAEAVDRLLCKPFERTAVNGFGFLQIVRPRTRASLLELAHDRLGFEARALLRRAAFDGGGRKRLVANPAMTAFLQARPDWLVTLSGQVGGEIDLRAEPSLPIHGPYVEKG